MKHKTNIGPGLIVALGAPGGGGGGSATGRGCTTGDRGSVNAISNATNTDTVPLDVLSMPDDQEQMQPPEVGDVVNYQVTGKVVAIEGNDAKVQRQSINGQDLPGSDDESNDNDNPSSAGGTNQSGGSAAGGGSTTGGDDGDGQSLRNDAAGIGMLS